MKREVEVYECGCLWAPLHNENGTIYSGYLIHGCPTHGDEGPHPADPHHIEIRESYDE